MNDPLTEYEIQQAEIDRDAEWLGEPVKDIVPVSRMHQKLKTETSPVETKHIEEEAAAEKAYAKERGDYEGFVRAAYVYVMARRRTTELVQPEILHGSVDGYGNHIVTLADFGFTKMQWNRRVKELEIPLETINAYFDECIALGWHPSLFGLWKFKEHHVHISTGENEWYTPAEFIEAARLVMGTIDLDPASSVQAQAVVKAGQFYTQAEDGLQKTWTGNVWLNPPYSYPEVEFFTEKAVRQYEAGTIQQAVILTNNATDTAWFQLLARYPFCLPLGRIHFWNPAGRGMQTRQGQAFFYLGERVPQFVKIFSSFGVVVRNYDNP